MAQWLDNTFPSWLMGIIIIGGGALLTWIAVDLRHRRVKPGEPNADNDLTAVFVLIVAGMYGVLAAFMIFSVWTTYDNAQQASSTEGGALTTLARQSLALPNADRQELLVALRSYVNSVISDEWPTMAHGQASPTATQRFNHLFVVADSLPSVSTSSDINAELTNLSEARTGLLLASRTALPAVFWVTLLIGAMSAIALSIFFFSETPRTHGTMAVAAAVVILAGLWLILELDYPLSGDTAFGPSAFERALTVISSVQSGHV